MNETPPPTNAYTVTEIPPHILEQAQKDLRSWRESRQKQGVDTLLEYGEIGFPILLEIVAKKHELKCKWAQYILIFQALTILLCLIWIHYGYASWGASVSMLVNFLIGMASLHIDYRMARLLSKMEDKRVLPYILSLTATASICDSLYKHLLPQLTFEDTYRLPITAQHRTKIHSLLKRDDNALIIAVLKALEQVGNHTSIEPVYSLMKTTQSAEIRERCRDCLSYLEVNSSKHEQAQTLLRASSAENIATEELLRPIKEGQSEPSEELLRTLSDTKN